MKHVGVNYVMLCGASAVSLSAYVISGDNSSSFMFLRRLSGVITVILMTQDPDVAKVDLKQRLFVMILASYVVDLK